MHPEVLFQALDERRVLQLTYGPGGVRLVQPHAVLRKADGTELLEAYQIRGPSGRPDEHGWRHFELRKIDDIRALPERFEPRRDFRPVSSDSGRVVAQVRAETAPAE